MHTIELETDEVAALDELLRRTVRYWGDGSVSAEAAHRVRAKIAALCTEAQQRIAGAPKCS